MKLLLSMESHKILQESVNNFEKTLDRELNENIGVMLGSPFKFMKIKKAAKKLQKALVQQSLNDLDMRKKMQASKGERTKKETETLKSATATKNAALKDQAGAITLKMDTAATTDGLKTVATLAKANARIAAAETALKNATDSESKILKVRLKKAQMAAAGANKEMGEYESTVNDDGVSPAAAEETTPPKPDEKQIEALKKTIEKLETSVNDQKAAIKTKEEAGEDTSKLAELLKKAEKNLKTNKDLLAKAEGKPAESTPAESTPASSTPAASNAPAAGNAPKDNKKTGKDQFDADGDNKLSDKEREAKNSKDGKIKRYQDLLAKTDDEDKKAEIQTKIDKLQKESIDKFMDPKYLSIVENELVEFEKAILG